MTKKKCSWLLNSYLGKCFFELALWLSKYIPCLIPKINQLFYAAFSKRNVHVEQGYNEIQLYPNVKHTIYEYSIPR